jgi:hypothetical protein
MLDEKLPFSNAATVQEHPQKPTQTTAPTAVSKISTAVENPYATLPWKPSDPRYPNQSIIRETDKPIGLEKELIEKVRSSKGKYYMAGYTYEETEFHGVKYLHRWEDVKRR